MKTKEVKRLEAEERNAKWKSLSNSEKMDKLAERGHSNCRQYDYLEYNLTTEQSI